MKHTKGPWYVNKDNLKGGLLFVDKDYKDGKELTSVAICEVKLTSPIDAALADAKLIAAAPDLLAALSDLVIAHNVKMGKSALKLRIELAKEAIKKATE